MSSVGVTFANRVLGLRLAPALQIDKAKVVPVFYSHSCQNAYSRQHPFAELCANSEHGDGKDAILHDKKVESWRQDPERNTEGSHRAVEITLGGFLLPEKQKGGLCYGTQNHAEAADKNQRPCAQSLL